MFIRNLTFISLLPLLATLTGCGLGMGDGKDTQGGLVSREAILESFEANVMPTLSANCGSCHGSTQSPLFALANPESAWSNIEDGGLINTGTAASSRLVIKGGQSHGGCPSCGASVSDEIKNAIQDHIDAVAAVSASNNNNNNGGGGGGSSVAFAQITNNLNIPVNLGTNYQELRFDLGVSGFPGATFSIMVRTVTEGGGGVNYEFNRPRLITAGADIKIKDVKVWLNDDYNPQNATYTTLEGHISANSEVTLSTQGALVVDENGALADRVKVSFGILEQNAAVPACQEMALFTTLNNQIQNQCIGCHANNSAWSMAADAATRCEEALQRVSRELNTKSILYTIGAVGGAGLPLNHPNTFNAAGQTALLDWISAERSSL